MRLSLLARAALTLATALALGVPLASQAGRPRPPSTHESVGFENFLSPQANPIALSPDGGKLYVANTTSGTVSVLATSSNAVIATVAVGVEPVSVAVRPDGNEVWVSNHVSDTVSVIDTNPTSPTFHRVIETIQDLDAQGATLFDEPVGIAFASNTKAYVALSSRNDIAVVDAVNYEVTGRIHVTAQEPRAIAVRNGLLYVAAFETGNQTQLSACGGLGDDTIGSLCSLGVDDLVTFATDPNLPNNVKNIVVDTGVPDRDLFVYNTANDQLVEAVTGVGTLLYGLTVSSTGQVFISQTEARNEVNGDHDMVLADLDNRMFLDEIATTSCSVGGGCGAVTVFDLHAATPPPGQPAPGTELSTPYGIAISDDDQWLVGTSAGNSRAFLMTAGGVVKTRLDLGSGADLGQQIPRGVALRSNGSGEPQTAYVLNTLENTVAVVSVAIHPDPTPPTLTLVSKVGVGADPTPQDVRRGEIAFSSSLASSSGTFSCASCHPDGNTDQLLWRIGGACPAIGCGDGDEPRSTMPIRGLRDTLPLHWDGTLGDPVGGRNGATTANLAPVLQHGRPRRRPRLLPPPRRREPLGRDVRPAGRLRQGSVRAPWAADGGGARRHGGVPRERRLPAGALAAHERPGLRNRNLLRGAARGGPRDLHEPGDEPLGERERARGLQGLLHQPGPALTSGTPTPAPTRAPAATRSPSERRPTRRRSRASTRRRCGA